MSRFKVWAGLLAGLVLTGWLNADGPRTAVLDFARADSPGSFDAAVTDFSRAVQAGLLENADYAWVERQEMDRIARENDQAGLGRADATTAVRLGHLLRADLLVRGELATPAGGTAELRLEVVDMKHAELLASRTVALSTGSRQRLQPAPAEIKAVQAAALAALAEARTQLDQPGRRVIAPLYFKNISRTERAGFVEGKLFEALGAAAKTESGLRVLRFPRAGIAGEESSLVLAGLTETDPEAWQRVADAYVWGTIEEQPADNVAFEDTLLKIDVQVWQGAAEPHAVHWEGAVKTLPAGLQSVAAGVVVAAKSAEARDATARVRIAAFLKQRADEVKTQIQRNRGPGATTLAADFLRSPAGRQLFAYRQRLLETACFFDPLNRALQEERLAVAWAYENPTQPLADLRGHWERLADLQTQARRFGRRADGSLDPVWVRQQTAALGDLLKTLEHAPWDAKIEGKAPPEDLQRQRRAAFNLWGAAVVTANQPPAAATAEDNELWRDDLASWLGDAGDVGTARALLEQTWPALQPAIGTFLKDSSRSSSHQNFINELYSIYDSFGEYDRLAGMLDAAWKAGVTPLPGVQDRPLPPRQDRPWRVQLSPQEQMRQMLPPQITSPNLPVLEAVVRDVEYWPEKSYYQSKGGSRVLEKTSGRLIDALAWQEGRLWIGETGGPMPVENGPENPQGFSYLWRYDPALHTAEYLTPQLGAHSPLRAVVPAGSDVWLALDADGVWRRDASGEIKRFGPDDGLASPRALAAQSAQGDLFVLGGTPPNYAISRYHGATGQWTVIPLPAAAQPPVLPNAGQMPGMNPNGMNASPPQFALCGNLLGVATPVPAWYDLTTNTWVEQKLPLPPLQLPANFPVKVAPPSGPPPLSLVSADDDAFWLGAPNHLLVVRPQAPDKNQDLPLPGTPTGAAHHGPWLWLTLDDGMGSTRLALVDKRTVTCVALSARIDRSLRRIVATDNRLWLGGFGLMEVVLKEPRPSGSAPQPAALSDHALLRAAWQGDAAGVDRQLAAGTDINETSASGWSALMLATEAGNPALVQHLLAKKAQPNLLARDGTSALSLALQQSDTALAETLLQGGADANLRLPVRVPGIRPGRTLVEDVVLNAETKTMPDQPTDLKVTLDPAGRAVLTWRERAAGPDVRYHVTRDKAVIADLPSGAGRAVDLNVPWGQAEVVYEVSAANAVGYWDGKHEWNPPQVKLVKPVPPSHLVGLSPTFSTANVMPMALPVFTLASPPLVAAAVAGRTDLIELLLAHRADPALTDGLGDTALLAAVRGGKYAAARQLLAAGASAETQTETKDSAASVAYARHDDEAFFRELLAALPPAARTLECSSLMLEAARHGQNKDLEILRDHGGDPGAFSAAGESALGRAIAADRFETAMWILDQKPRLHQVLRRTLGKMNSDEPLLDAAVRNNRPAIISRLLAAGCDPNLRVNGVPLTILAAQRKSLETLRILLAAGADPQLTAAGESRKLADYLAPAEAEALLGTTAATANWPLPISRGGRNPPWTTPQLTDAAKQPLTEQLVAACKAGNIAAAAAAVQAGALLDQRSEDGRNPLHHALITRHPEVARWLVAEGASVNVISRGGNPPLNFAIQNGAKPDMIDDLLAAGADPDAFGNESYPPLFSAVISNNHAAVRRLLETNANVNLEGYNDEQLTLLGPLGAALRRGDQEVVGWLLAAGANPRAQNYRFLHRDGKVIKQAEPSLLMYAAGGKDVALLRQMIALGQNPQFKAANGEDALTWAAMVGGKEAVEFLLPLSQPKGQALAYARKKNYPEIAALLEQTGYQDGAN